MLKQTTLLLLSLVLLSTIVTAQNLQFTDYTITLEINENNEAQETIRINLTNLSNEPLTNLDYSISTPITNFSASDKLGKLNTLQNEITYSVSLREPINKDGNTTIILNFTTNSLVTELETNNLFNIGFTAPAKINDFTLKLTLPKGSYLPKAIETQAPLDTLPEPDLLETDGERITMTWIRTLDTKENFGVITTFSKPEQIIITKEVPVTETIIVNQVSPEIYLLFLLLILLSLALGYLAHGFIYASQSTKVSQYMGVLRSNEQEIIKFLKQGPKTQAELRTLTGFSKAKLSRLLYSMYERGLVSKQQKGRTNLIMLKNKDE